MLSFSVRPFLVEFDIVNTSAAFRLAQIYRYNLCVKYRLMIRYLGKKA